MADVAGQRQAYRPRNARPSYSACARSSVSAPSSGFAGYARSRLSKTPHIDVRPWLLLAPASGLQQGIVPQIPNGILASEVRRERAPGCVSRRTPRSSWVARRNDLGVRNQRRRSADRPPRKHLRFVRGATSGGNLAVERILQVEFAISLDFVVAKLERQIGRLDRSIARQKPIQFSLFLVR